jgi:tetratricopeptide (TPR) repeat protein
MKHLAERDLPALWNGLLKPAALQRALRHLVRGCPECGRRVLQARPVGSTFREQERVPAAAYDAAIDRAAQRVGRFLDKGLAAERFRTQELMRLRGSEGFGTCPPPDLSGLSAWARVEIYLQRSWDCRYSAPEKMLDYARKAREEADGIRAWPYGAKLLLDLRARVWGELANAYRVAESYDSAAEAFRHAHQLLDQGTGDLSIRAGFFEVESSLQRALRHFEDALDLLNEAEGIYRRLGAKAQAIRTVMRKGSCLLYAGRAHQGAVYLRQAFEQIDSRREPELAAAAAHNLFDVLVNLGDVTEASELLRRSGLRKAFAGDPLNALRVRWVRARVLAARGRLPFAERVLEDVRATFRDDFGLHYDAALAGLDLAHARARQGKPIYDLAVELREQSKLHGVNPQAVLALDGLVMIAWLDLAGDLRRRALTRLFIEGIRAFLVQLQHAPHLRYDPRRWLVAAGA